MAVDKPNVNKPATPVQPADTAKPVETNLANGNQQGAPVAVIPTDIPGAQNGNGCRAVGNEDYTEMYFDQEAFCTAQYLMGGSCDGFVITNKAKTVCDPVDGPDYIFPRYSSANDICVRDTFAMTEMNCSLKEEVFGAANRIWGSWLELFKCATESNAECVAKATGAMITAVEDLVTELSDPVTCTGKVYYSAATHTNDSGSTRQGTTPMIDVQVNAMNNLEYLNLDKMPSGKGAFVFGAIEGIAEFFAADASGAEAAPAPDAKKVESAKKAKAAYEAELEDPETTAERKTELQDLIAAKDAIIAAANKPADDAEGSVGALYGKAVRECFHNLGNFSSPEKFAAISGAAYVARCAAPTILSVDGDGNAKRLTAKELQEAVRAHINDATPGSTKQRERAAAGLLLMALKYANDATWFAESIDEMTKELNSGASQLSRDELNNAKAVIDQYKKLKKENADQAKKIFDVINKENLNERQRELFGVLKAQLKELGAKQEEVVRGGGNDDGESKPKPPKPPTPTGPKTPEKKKFTIPPPPKKVRDSK